MATRTLGTAATTTLTAVLQGTNTLIADIATIQRAIKNDQINGNPIFPGAYEFAQGGTGMLYIPNRGVLQVLAGDIIGVDSTGWPILVSKTAAASVSWSHT